MIAGNQYEIYLQVFTGCKDPSKTEITYEAFADPGGSLPSWLVSMLTKDLGIKTMAGIRKLSATAKYKNAKEIATIPR